MNNENDIRRAELHINTKTSKEISTIKLSEAIKRAEELELSAIAISNFKNANDFSKILKVNRENKANIKIICGVELPFTATSQAIKTKGYSLTLLAKNQDGVNALQELASNLTPDEKNPACELLDLDILKKNRENLLIGSTGHRGEIFYETKWWWEFPKDYKKMAEFYDFFEIFPPRKHEDQKTIEKVVELSKAFHIPIVATSYALSLSISDEEKRLEEMKIKRRYHDGGNYILRSTDELLEEFSFLGKDIAYEAVIKNPNKLVELIKY